MQWLSSRSVATVWLLAALSLVGWLIVNLDVAGWIIHPAWDRLKAALQEGFARVGADTRLAKRLYRLFRGAGLEDVRYRPFLVGVTSGEPMADYLPATIESIRSTLVNRGILAEAEIDAALAACRRHLADPDTVSTSFLTAQVWGRKAATGPS